ncbi:GNAT family N-acetyltransferase [Paenibacillus silviterrae]|uniref:GNAT family N-acetyltransferase n=1 Tax=Paenibacillus silviterrae TaxID=3242194 RepID=UPI002543512A|nr:GNAT family N-acetyltransferase [Paenibacillus chinjuensis]
MVIVPTMNFELIATLNQPAHELHVSLYPDYFKQYDFEAMREFFKKAVTNEKFVFLLIEDDGFPLGYAWIEMKTYSENVFTKQRRTLFVHQISIIEERKSRGYGSHLMNYIYELAKSEGLDDVQLDYWVENEHAKNFYNKQGFVAYREFVYKKI